MGMITIRQTVSHGTGKRQTTMIAFLLSNKLGNHIDQLTPVKVRHAVHIDHPFDVFVILPIDEIRKILLSHLTNPLVGNGILISAACAREESQQEEQERKLFHF